VIRRLLAATALALVAGAGGARAAPKGSPWGASYFPDVPLTTQDGETVRFYRDLVENKFVLVNFIYTHCTKTCPLETANLVRVQRRLASRVGKDIFLYSITLDPQRDTPEVLKAYAQAFHAGPGWLFLTGKREDIQAIRARFRDRTTVEDHAVSLLVGNDRAGQWTSLSALDDPGFLALNIDHWMSVDPMRHAPVKSYADAPRGPRPSAGEDLFRQKCAACHTIGRGDLLGPDLADVTRRRDRAWLARWLADPRKLVEEKDPIAAELSSRSGAVRMPNLALTRSEIDALIVYMESASRATAGSSTADDRGAYPTSASLPGDPADVALGARVTPASPPPGRAGRASATSR
jgi:protein SCO1/2